MVINLQPLTAFQKGANPAESWKKWRAEFENYKLALRYHKEEQQVQIALFLQVCGEELRRKYETFSFPPLEEGQERTLNEVLKAFDRHFKPYQNVELASFVFWNLKQEEGQSFDDFLTAIVLQAKQCDFGAAEERNIKDKIFHGIRDGALRERLLVKSDLTLEKLIIYCKTAEISHSHASDMALSSNSGVSNTQTSVVEAIHKSAARTHSQNAGPGRNSKQNRSNFSQIKSTVSEKNMCSWCGLKHLKGKCPAYGMKCNFCHKLNHWEKVCKKKKTDQRPIHNVEVEDSSGEDLDEILYLGELKVCNLEKESEWYEIIDVESHEVNFKLDSGAQVSVLPWIIVDSWNVKPTIEPTSLKISTYTGQMIPVMGRCKLLCTANGERKKLDFVIVKGHQKPLLGLQGCKKLKLIERTSPVLTEKNKKLHVMFKQNRKETPQSIVDEYSDVFEGLGCLPGEFHIELKQNVTPYIASPRLIPQSIEKTVKKELDSMVEQHVIERVQEPSDWVSNLKIVNKNNKLRLCLDPIKLNDAIKRPHCRIPTRRELVNKLQGTNLFSLFDVKKGFWQIKLDKESSKLTTFITPYGRYRFLRMPFGLNCAPEAFQQAMDRIFEKEPHLNPYFDDLLIGTENVRQHCIQVRNLLEIAKKSGLKLNRDKLQLGVNSVRYLGHMLTNLGMKPNQEKLEAVTSYPEPRSKEELRRFLGMATYLMQYVKGFSEYTLPLRNLLKKNSAFLWDENSKAAFNCLKQRLVDSPVLHYFNPEVPIIISTDASSYGVGAVLLQQGHPVAYASATLNGTQQRYAQVEKELLAVVFGLEKFHYYVYGRQITVHTDHKPLIGLVAKPYHTASPTLQKLLLRWERYQSSILYVPGKKLAVADALSRAPLVYKQVHTHDNEKRELCLVAKITDAKLVQMRDATARDEVLKQVIEYVLGGWPSDKKKVNAFTALYWPHQTELHFTKGLLCRGQRLVIPEELRGEVLKQLHIGHRGIVACKNKARQAVYWPGMDCAIEKMVASCQLCQKYQNLNRREPLYTQEPIPEGPWQKLAIDFLTHKQQVYMIVIDYFSKYVELIPMKLTTSSLVIRNLYEIYSHHGFPLTIVTDNGPPFNSHEFDMFNKQYGITHSTSSPLYPRSNGQVERAVETIKRGLKKIDGEMGLASMLLDYRTTPANDMPSPAEALMGRKLRTFYPINPTLLKPQFECRKIVKSLQKRQEAQQVYANVGTSPIKPLQIGGDVWFWTGHQWEKGKLTRESKYPRSYIVAGPNGKLFRRNRIHIRKRLSSVPNDVHEGYIPSSPVEQAIQRTVNNCPSSSDDQNYSSKIDLRTKIHNGDENETKSKELIVIPKDPEITNPVTQPTLGYCTRSGREVRRPARFND